MMRSTKKAELIVATDPSPEQILRTILISLQEVRGLAVEIRSYEDNGEDDAIEVSLASKDNRSTSASIFHRGTGSTITNAINDLCRQLLEFDGRLSVGGRKYIWNKSKKRFVRNDDCPDEIRLRADNLVREAEELRQLADKIASEPVEKKPVVIDLSIPAGAQERRERELIKLFQTDFNNPLPNPPYEPKRCRKIIYCIERACYERFDGRSSGSYGLQLGFSGSPGSGSSGFIPEPYAGRVLSACGLTQKSAPQLVGRFCWVASNSDEISPSGSRYFLEPLLSPEEIKNLPKELTYRGQLNL